MLQDISSFDRKYENSLSFYRNQNEIWCFTNERTNERMRQKSTKKSRGVSALKHNSKMNIMLADIKKKTW